MAARIDLKPADMHLYTASSETVTLAEIPPAYFLMAEGQGDPDTAASFQQAAETLFHLSYLLKYRMKKAQGLDWVTMPLEGLWSFADLSDHARERQTELRWTLMIRQPDFVAPEHLADAIKVATSGKNASPLYPTVLRRYAEGFSAQILHLGPCADKHLTIARLHAFIKEKGYHFGGPHHEIYLPDPRHTAPEKLKTIIRQPITLEVMK